MCYACKKHVVSMCDCMLREKYKQKVAKTAVAFPGGGGAQGARAPP